MTQSRNAKCKRMVSIIRMTSDAKSRDKKQLKPPGFWDDFANLKTEIEALITELETPGILPSASQMAAARRTAINAAIAKHGGRKAVADKLGLTYSYDAAPTGYFNDPNNVEAELRKFLEGSETPDVMPTSADLVKASRSSLAAAISRHGGVNQFAERMGLRMSHSQKTKGYWKDFENLRVELLQFVDSAQDPQSMPSSKDLRDGGRADLENPIRMHGGTDAVAKRLNLKTTSKAKPAGYWDDFENIRKEVMVIVGDSGIMPTKTSLEKTGRNDLAVAIGRKHGGFKGLADKLGIERAYKAKEPGYWQVEENVVRELLQFITDYGTPGQMPTYNEMREKGLARLADEITKLGGPSQVAKKLDLVYTNPQKQQGYWDSFDNLAKEIRAFLETQENKHAMPLDSALRAAGKNGILNALRKFGGSNAVADRLGITRASSSKGPGYWEDFENIKKELLDICSHSSEPTKMPSTTELRDAGLSTLAAVISTKFGGFQSVAKALDLRFDGAGVGWTVETLRHFVSSLVGHLETFSPAELHILFQQNGLWQTEGKSRAFIRAITTGRFPQEELQKFVDGETSLVDKFLDDSSLTLEKTLTQSVDALLDDKEHLVADDEIEKPEILPSVSTKDVLKALDTRIVATADAEAAEFLIASGLAKIWKHAYRSKGAEQIAVAEAKQFTGEGYAARVRDKFLNQYRKAIELQIPAGYAFKVKGVPVQPNLMQRHIASRLQEDKRMGNWSGTGAGKTLSAVLASRVTQSELTVICCPNSVVDGWKHAILQAFPSSVVCTKTFDPTWPNTGSSNRYLVLNYETFQQSGSGPNLQQFLERERIDFIVVDEIHYAKHRKADDEQSKRRKLVAAMVSAATQNNPELYVLGMSATPVINNLQEGKSLVELITGLEHDELSIKPTISNCMALHQRLVTLGTRWMPEYEPSYEQITEQVDVTEFLPEIRQLGERGPLALEQILTRARLPVILKHIRRKTLIYTYYVEEIDKILRKALEAENWKVGFYTGEDKSGLDGFINGDLDVLIGSAAIGTGVDGLQQVCDRLIVNVLPWTAAEFEQLKGRIYRQGQQSSTVTMVLPLTFAEINGQHWSWCESKMHRLDFKKSVADAAVDGVVPEGQLRSPAQAYHDVLAWLKRLETGDLRIVSRQPIVVPLADLSQEEFSERFKRYGEFSTMNNVWNQSYSATTHERLRQNSEEWVHYHTLYSAARESWPVVPYQEMIRRFQKRKGLVIADFGCGQAEFATALSGIHQILSFDHVAIADFVTACDMSKVPLEDQVLDAAVFSLSLMGKNFDQYLREAHRTLKIDGQLHLVEATSRFSDRHQFLRSLTQLGFDNLTVEDMSEKFTYIRCEYSR